MVGSAIKKHTLFTAMEVLKLPTINVCKFNVIYILTMLYITMYPGIHKYVCNY